MTDQKKTIVTKKAQSLIPELRFGEFDGEWEENKLGDISKVERGRFSPRPRNNPIYYNGKIPFVQTSDVVNSNGRILNYSQTLNEKGLAVSKQFKKGSILITIAANIGYAGVLQIDMACPDSLIGITCKESTHNYFLNYQLELEQSKMDYLAVAAAQKNINIEFLKPYKFNLPNLPEQQKIANFLTSVDTKIQQLTTKKELLEQYKKGVMQQLFNQKLRFKDDDGHDFVDWEEKTLGEVAKFSKGKSISKNDIVEEGELECIRYGELYTHYKELIYDIKSRTNLNPDKLVLSENNDVIIPASGETQIDIATASCVFKDGVALGGDLNIIKTEMSGIFLSYCLNSDKKLEIARLSQGISVVHLYSKQLKTLKILVPSKYEQQKIATFLISVDKKIDTVSTQIAHTQQFKKGLLQQMFV